MNLNDRIRRRRAELLGITITELTIVLLFVLFVYSQEGDRDLQNAQAKIDALEKDNKELVGKNRDLKKELRENKERLALMERLLRLLEAQTEYFNIEHDKVTYENADEYVQKIEAQINGGRDKPNCLPENQYLLSVWMGDDGFTVAKIGVEAPERLESELQAMVGTFDRKEQMRTKEAAQAFKTIFAWSVEHECRFFVELYDKTTRKDTFVRNSDMIEKYFYRKKMW